MASVHRATLLNFDPATWTAYVLIDGSDVEALIPVAQWLPASMLVADTEVAIITFDPTNLGDAMLIGPYGGTPMATAIVAMGGLNLGSANTAGAGGLAASGGATFGGNVVATGLGAFTVADASTNTQPLVEVLYHKLTAGSPAAGFGMSVYFQADDTTTPQTTQAAIITQWVVSATHAAKQGRLSFYVSDYTTTREALRLEANGTAPAIGFLGAAAVARPTVTGSRGGNAALASLLTALASLGLITDSTTA